MTKRVLGELAFFIFLIIVKSFVFSTCTQLDGNLQKIPDDSDVNRNPDMSSDGK